MVDVAPTISSVPQELRIDETLRLVMFSPDDAPHLYDLVARNREYFRFLPWAATYTPEKAEEEIAHIGAMTAAGRFLDYKVLDETDTIVASIGFWGREGSTANIGYFRDEVAAHKGIVTRAARRLIGHGFENWGLETVHFRAQLANTGSISVASNLGASLIGGVIQEIRDGEALQLGVWEITKNDWILRGLLGVDYVPQTLLSPALRGVSS